MRKVISPLKLQRTDSGSVGVGWGLSVCMSEMLPGDATDLELTPSKQMLSSQEGGDGLQTSVFLQLYGGAANSSQFF